MASRGDTEDLYRNFQLDLDTYEMINLGTGGEATLRSLDYMIESSIDVPRKTNSYGEIHLDGAGIKDHSAPIRNLGDTLVCIQGVVDSIGASLEEWVNPVGQIPRSIQERTNLCVIAAPSSGSLRLKISPEKDGYSEVFPEGVNLFGHDSFGARPLADLALGKLIELMSELREETPDTEEFVNSLVDYGPRVASGLKNMFESFAKGFFDVEMSWKEPERERRVARITREQSVYAVSVITNAKVAVETIELTGLLVTSTMSNKDKIRIQIDTVVHNEAKKDLTFSLGGIDPIVMSSFHPHQRVTVSVEKRIGHYPGGKTVEKFKGISIKETPKLQVI